MNIKKIPKQNSSNGKTISVKDYNELAQWAEDAQEEIKRLDKYTKHYKGCAFDPPYQYGTCDCGLNK